MNGYTRQQCQYGLTSGRRWILKPLFQPAVINLFRRRRRICLGAEEIPAVLQPTLDRSRRDTLEVDLQGGPNGLNSGRWNGRRSLGDRRGPAPPRRSTRISRISAASSTTMIRDTIAVTPSPARESMARGAGAPMPRVIAASLGRAGRRRQHIPSRPVE